MRYLILENDKKIDDVILAFINSNYFKDGDEFPDITGLSYKENLSEDDYYEFEKCDTYIFSSTFFNKDQIKRILNLINAQSRPKTLYIYYPSDRLYIGIKDIFDQFHEEIIKFRKGGHSICEIECDEKEGNNPQKYFKDIRYFFDLIPYYWNTDYAMFTPERPKCIFEDSNINTFFKYKPEWKLR